MGPGDLVVENRVLDRDICIIGIYRYCYFTSATNGTDEDGFVRKLTEEQLRELNCGHIDLWHVVQ